METPIVPKPGGVTLGPRMAVGGMGEVFRATVGVGGREVPCVVKMLLPGSGELERALFSREARALAALTRLPARRFAHLLGADEERLVIELVEGADLATVLAHRRKRGRPMPVPAAVALGVALGEALVELEAAEEGGRRLGLVHRDLQPGNVVVGRDGVVKVIDLGVATFAALEATSANPRGTLAYMAPEQLREGRVSAASDVYAVGLMLWEALVGEPARPPGEGSLGDLLTYRHTVPELIGGRRAGVPEALEAWVMRALAVEPEARPGAAELRDGMRAVAVEVGAGEAALAALVGPLVGEAGELVGAVRAAPTLGGARGEVARVASEVPRVDRGVEGAGGGAKRRLWGVGAVGLMGLVGVAGAAAAVIAMAGRAGPGSGLGSGGPGSGSGSGSGSGGPGSDGPGSGGPGSTVLDNVDGEGRAEDASVASSAGASAPPTSDSTGLGRAWERWASAAGALPMAAVDWGLAAASGHMGPRSTVLDNAGEGLATAPTLTPTPTPAPTPAPAPTALTVLPLEGPLHVSGLGAKDLAPQTTSALAPSTSGLLRLTGGSPPLIALVRVTHGDAGALTATVGAPPGEVYEVTCGGRSRPTPAAGLAIGPRLACRVTAQDGRALAFALRRR